MRRTHQVQVQSYTQNAASNMLRWYAMNMPAELPAVVARLEGRPMALGQEETADTRNWFQRGLAAIGDLGAKAVTVIGSYELQQDKREAAQTAADQEWQVKLAEQRRLAEEVQLRAAQQIATAQSQQLVAAAASEAAALAREQQAAKTRRWIMPAIGAVAVAALLWFWTTQRGV